MILTVFHRYMGTYAYNYELKLIPFHGRVFLFTKVEGRLTRYEKLNRRRRFAYYRLCV